MMNTEELGRQIETLVRAHLTTCREAVTAAVERAFTGAMCAAPASQEQRKKVRARKPSQPRRSAEELQKLSERLYAEVCAAPGKTITELAAQMKTSPRSLQGPLGRLKREGRVRSAGQRQFTHYFPMVGGESTTKASVVADRRAS